MVDTTDNLPFNIGDRVAHLCDPDVVGYVRQIDTDCYPLEVYGVTTCLVEWNNAEPGILDIQWTNKLALAP